MNTLDLTKEKIDEICSSNEVLEAFINLYRIPFPNWEEIEKLDHFPKVSKTTAFYILDKFSDTIMLHPENNPTRQDLMMLWLNKGFGIDEKLEDWKVSFNPDGITYPKGEETDG